MKKLLNIEKIVSTDDNILLLLLIYESHSKNTGYPPCFPIPSSKFSFLSDTCKSKWQ